MSQRVAQPGSSAQASVPALNQVSELLHHLDDVRRARNEDCVRLLQQLTPHLHAARAVERELDRHLARRFNAFRYLRDDELGLSRIIAELLDPTGEHGQGTTFLEAMLELLGFAPAAGDPVRPGLDHSGGQRAVAATWKARFGRLRSTPTHKIRVVQERGGLPKSRRIDITVDIPTDDGVFCLAFENKPYADDQPYQCRDYLRFLDRVYRGSFLLVYLPPRYRMPDASSLSPEDRQRWKNHFRVLPYVADDAPPGDEDSPDEDSAALAQADPEDDSHAEHDPTDHDVTAAQDDAAVGDGASLAEWFGTCCKLSEAERLRWFLREAQLYCQHHFGDSTMTDTEARYIREYLEDNPRHLHAASAVARAWPALKHDVCRRFLEHLRDRVAERVREEFPEVAGDLSVRFHYGGKQKWWSDYLCVYRSGWTQCEGALDLGADGRTAVVLTTGGGANAWHWGVFNGKSKNDMSDQERSRCDKLENALREHGLSLPAGDHHSPQYQYSPHHRDWSAIVPELAQELADHGGKITDHYVNGVLGIAAKAFPAIDEVELENGSPAESGNS